MSDPGWGRSGISSAEVCGPRLQQVIQRLNLA